LAITDSKNADGNKEPVVSVARLEVMLIMSILNIICLQLRFCKLLATRATICKWFQYIHFQIIR
jgi:hypothetical protein